MASRSFIGVEVEDGWIDLTEKKTSSPSTKDRANVPPRRHISSKVSRGVKINSSPLSNSPKKILPPSPFSPTYDKCDLSDASSLASPTVMEVQKSETQVQKPAPLIETNVPFRNQQSETNNVGTFHENPQLFPLEPVQTSVLGSSLYLETLSPLSIVDSAVRSIALARAISSASTITTPVGTPLPPLKTSSALSMSTSILFAPASSPLASFFEAPLAPLSPSESEFSTVSEISPSPRSVIESPSASSEAKFPQRFFPTAETKPSHTPFALETKSATFTSFWIASSHSQTSGSFPETSPRKSASWSDIVQTMEAKQQQYWECPSCTLHNPLWQSTCGACQHVVAPAPKSQKQVVRKIRPMVEALDLYVEETPKEWSTSSRARKFGEFGTGSGSTVWAAHVFMQPKPTSLMKKIVRLPQGMAPNDEKAWKAPTAFEVETGLIFPSGRGTGFRGSSSDFSLDKKKRWEWAGNELKEASDVVVTTPHGHKDQWTAKGVGNTEISSFVMLQPVTYGKKEGKEDKEIAEYLDQLAKSAKLLAKNQVTTTRQQRIHHCRELPKGIDCPRLRFTLKSRSVSSELNLRAAKVENEHYASFWAPNKLADGGDYLDVDLGKMMLVVAIGTKGRALLRDQFDVVCSDSKTEWVTRYKAFWKGDEHDVWKPLGDFAANNDTETEVANFVLNPHTEQPGLQLRYLRLQPTAFHHRKSMRVGVYGKEIEVAAEIDPRSTKQQLESKQMSLDDVTSKMVVTPSVIFRIESTVSKEKAGKFNFEFDTLERGGPSRAVERRRCKRADRNKLRSFGRFVASDAAGENLANSVFCASTFPRTTMLW